MDLKAGDTVRIHYRTEPYREKIGLHVRGNEEAPISIIGVKGPDGELPVLSGENAVTNSQFNNFFTVWDEYLGVFVIKRASGDAWGHKPGYLLFENLKIVGAKPSNSYTDISGGTSSYADGAAAIWAVLAEHLVIRNCEITDNGNGIFVLSKDNRVDENSPFTDEEISRDIIIEKNYIYDNGNAGSFLQHNIYTAAAGTVIQYNKIGALRPGAEGSSLKDRSSGTVIRYNWIEASARALDLVDPEDSPGILTAEPDFHQTYVYGNLILNDNVSKAASGRVNCSRLIHYGGDTGEENNYRKGTLYFYNNTVVVKSSQELTWKHRFFDLSTNDETVALWNNILYLQGDVPEINLMCSYGIANLEGGNWLNTGWRNGDNGFAGTVNQNGTLIEGDDPVFNSNYEIMCTWDSRSPCLGQGVELPEAISEHHDIWFEYNSQYTYAYHYWRTFWDDGPFSMNGSNLGAFSVCYITELVARMTDITFTSLKVVDFTSDSIAYSYTLQNIGSQYGGPVPVNLDRVSIQGVLSADTIFGNADDISLEEARVGIFDDFDVLAPGESYTGSFRANAPVDISVTPYLILNVKEDYKNERYIYRENEDNNTISTRIMPVPSIIPAINLLLQ